MDMPSFVVVHVAMEMNLWGILLSLLQISLTFHSGFSVTYGGLVQCRLLYGSSIRTYEYMVNYSHFRHRNSCVIMEFLAGLFNISMLITSHENIATTW